MYSKSFVTAAALFVASANALAFPEAVAQLPGATYQCHEFCGNLILESRKCSETDNDCLCASGSGFSNLVDPCLDCGWQLWDYYGKYLVGPLGRCGLPTEPTGAKAGEAAESTTEAAAPTAAPQTTTEAPAPEPTTEEAPAPEPTTEAPAPEPSTEAPAVEPETTSEAPAPEPEATSESAAPEVTTPASEVVTSKPSSVSSAHVTSKASIITAKYENKTIATVSETKTHAQPTELPQVNGAVQYSVAGALAVAAGIAALI